MATIPTIFYYTPTMATADYVIYNGATNTYIICAGGANSGDFDFETNAFTIDFWFNFSVMQDMIFGQCWNIGVARSTIKYDAVNSALQLYSEGGLGTEILVQGTATGVNAFVPGQWHHIAYVREGTGYATAKSGWHFFIDGNELDISVGNYSGNYDWAGYEQWNLGLDRFYTNACSGFMDNFRLTTSARWISDFETPLQKDVAVDAETVLLLKFANDASDSTLRHSTSKTDSIAFNTSYSDENPQIFYSRRRQVTGCVKLFNHDGGGVMQFHHFYHQFQEPDGSTLYDASGFDKGHVEFRMPCNGTFFAMKNWWWPSSPARLDDIKTTTHILYKNDSATGLRVAWNDNQATPDGRDYLQGSLETEIDVPVVAGDRIYTKYVLSKTGNGTVDSVWYYNATYFESDNPYSSFFIGAGFGNPKGGFINVKFFPFWGGGWVSVAQSSELHSIKMGLAGTIQNLYVLLNSAIGGTTNPTVTYTLCVNDSATGLSATVPYTGTTAEDTTHKVNVQVGDTVYYQVTSTGNPAGGYQITHCTVEFISGTPNVFPIAHRAYHTSYDPNDFYHTVADLKVSTFSATGLYDNPYDLRMSDFIFYADRTCGTNAAIDIRMRYDGWEVDPDTRESWPDAHYFGRITGEATTLTGGDYVYMPIHALRDAYAGNPSDRNYNSWVFFNPTLGAVTLSANIIFPQYIWFAGIGSCDIYDKPVKFYNRQSF